VNPERKQVLLIYAFLAVVALAAFRQLGGCDFINYDDPLYLTENIHVQHGMTIDAVRWAFTTGYASNWHPLTWMSHMLDVQLFGLDPGRHHQVNLLFHIANTLLLFYVLNRMTEAPRRSALVAALFALHPLHVESVAWVTERKDVLSAFFWMLTMAAYVHYVERPSFARYSTLLIFFALGLMSKPMLVTLPFVLLLLDYWPLGRVAGAGRRRSDDRSPNQSAYSKRENGKWGKKNVGEENAPASASYSPPSATLPLFSRFRPSSPLPGRLFFEKVPLFFLSALSCIVTFAAQQKGGAVTSVKVIPPGARIANALVSYCVYMEKTLFPTGLAVFYPYPGPPPLWQVLGAALLLCAVTFAAIRAANRLPCLCVGWLWFLGTLVPVIGIVQVGAQAMADRYSYIPLIGLFIIAVWGIRALFDKLPLSRSLRNGSLLALWALVLTGLFIAAYRQAGYWKNSIALYDHTLSVTDRNDIILNNRGNAYARLGNYRQAISDYDRATEINPEQAEAYNNRGAAYFTTGDLMSARGDFDRAIAMEPGNAKAYNNRGAVRHRLGNFRQAILDYSRAIELSPEYAKAFNNRGLSYGALGDLRQAIEDFKRAIGISPKYAEACLNLAEAYSKIGDRRQAVENLQNAARLGSETAKESLRKGGMSR
jgi:Flp pilus assembly protein TadD